MNTERAIAWGSLCYLMNWIAAAQLRAMRSSPINGLLRVVFGVAPATAETRAAIAALQERVDALPMYEPGASVRAWANDAGLPWDFCPPWWSRAAPGELVCILVRSQRRPQA